MIEACIELTGELTPVDGSIANVRGPLAVTMSRGRLPLDGRAVELVLPVIDRVVDRDGGSELLYIDFFDVVVERDGGGE